MAKLFILLLFLSIVFISKAQVNSTCQNALLFCPNPSVIFPAGVNAGSAQAGPNYGCLASQPNPAWYYLNIASSGAISIQMSAPDDIDFICYGPFSTLNGACNNLTAGNTVGCSYSGSASETLTIANAIAGEYYLVMITNFVNYNQNITVSQLAGPGTLYCNYLNLACSQLCSGQTVTITGTSYNLSNPSFTLNPGGLTSTTPTFVINSPTVNTVFTLICSGVNNQTITQTMSSSITAVAYPSPTVMLYVATPTICSGSTSTLNLSGAITYTCSNGLITGNSTIVLSPTVTTTYTISGSSSSGCIDDEVITQYVSLCTNFKIHTGDADVKLFPNPATNILNIQNDMPLSKHQTLCIINCMGELKKAAEINWIENKIGMDISDLSNGVYLLLLSGRNTQYRFVILR